MHKVEKKASQVPENKELYDTLFNERIHLQHKHKLTEVV